MSSFARTLALTLVTLFATTSTAAAAEPTVELHETDRFDAANILEGQVNINTASAAELELLPGIGPATSALILAYRQDNPFKQTSHIMRVKGIGQKTYAKIKDHLSVEGVSTLKIVK